MARKDVEKLVSYIRSDKDAYFAQALRNLGSIIPASIRAHDRLTSEELVREVVDAFWYWDKRVPRIKDRKKLHTDEFTAQREEMRQRRDSLMGLLMLAREAADSIHSGGQGDKKRKGFASKINALIDDCEREWQLVADKRIAEGEMGGKWVVRIG